MAVKEVPAAVHLPGASLLREAGEEPPCPEQRYKIGIAVSDFSPSSAKRDLTLFSGASATSFL